MAEAARVIPFPERKGGRRLTEAERVALFDRLAGLNESVPGGVPGLLKRIEDAKGERE